MLTSTLFFLPPQRLKLLLEGVVLVRQRLLLLGSLAESGFELFASCLAVGQI